MDKKLDRIIKMVYRQWQASQSVPPESHPDEEAIVCFLEGRLLEAESKEIKSHIVKCSRCADIVAAHVRLQSQESEIIPDEKIIEKAKRLTEISKDNILEVILQLKDKFLEITSSTGDVLLDQELIPVSVLRSRQIKKFKDELIILKDFSDTRLELKVENKNGEYFNLVVTVKQKQTQAMLRDIRVTLLLEDTELESYLAESGEAVFEHLPPGNYMIEVFTAESKIASVAVQINN